MNHRGRIQRRIRTGAGVDGQGALGAVLSEPARLIVLGDGTVLTTEQAGHRVRKIDPSGIVSTFAGTGTEGFSGDGGPATSAQLAGPIGIVKWQDDICIADYGNARVRCVDAAGKSARSCTPPATTFRSASTISPSVRTAI